MTEKIIAEVDADLEAHVTDHWDIVFNRIFNRKIPLIGGKYYRGLQGATFSSKSEIANKLLEHCLKKAPNTLVGVANFGDSRAEDILNELRKIGEQKYRILADHGYALSITTDVLEENLQSVKELRKGELLPGQLWVPDKVANYLGVAKDPRTATFITAEEIPTDKGHVLVVGAGKNILYRNLTDVLRCAKEEHNALSLVTDTGIFLGAKEEDIGENYGLIDGVSVGNGNYGRFLYFKALQTARQFGKAYYVASDSHTLNGVLSCSTVLRNLDLKSGDAFKDSIRASLRKVTEKDLHFGSNGLLELPRFALSVYPTAFCWLPLGLMKRDFE